MNQTPIKGMFFMLQAETFESLDEKLPGIYQSSTDAAIGLLHEAANSRGGKPITRAYAAEIAQAVKDCIMDVAYYICDQVETDTNGITEMIDTTVHALAYVSRPCEHDKSTLNINVSGLPEELARRVASGSVTFPEPALFQRLH